MDDVVRISMGFKHSPGFPPSRIINLISRERINIIYLSYVQKESNCYLTLAISSRDKHFLSHIIKSWPDHSLYDCAEGVILSVFPHRKKPEIVGSLLEIFGREKIEVKALTNSPSAISVILDRPLLNKASQALFEPFTFSSYRSPADWKLAQKGKEALYREVVASYQEQRPKVYGLEYHDQQEFIRLGVNSGSAAKIGRAFRIYADLNLFLTFLSITPRDENGGGLTAFCFPAHDPPSSLETLKKTGLKTDLSAIDPVTVFSMNGPHFGDRYGIAGEIMESLESGQIELLGLNCTISSVTGVVSSHHFEPALTLIRSRFEVPSITRKS